MCYCRSKVNSSHFLTSISGKGDEAQAQCRRRRCRRRIFSRVRGGIWGDRLGRIERQLEKTCTRVPPRSHGRPRLCRTTDSFTNSKGRTQKRKGKEMKGASGLLEAKTDRRGRNSMAASMGVEECAKTLWSTAEELVSRTSPPAAASQPQPDLLRQVRALRHRPRAHLAGCWEGDQCEQDGQGRMQSEDPNSGPGAWAEGLGKIREQLDHDKDVGGREAAMWDYSLTFHSYFSTIESYP